MKSIVVSIVMFFTSMSVFSQNSKFDEIFNKFQGRDGITSIVLTSDLIKFASEMEDSGMNALKNITQVRILSLGNAVAQDVVAFENMLKEMSLSNFKELMVVKENKNNIRMLAQESMGRWSDFVLIVTGGKEHVLINVQGSISPKELQSLSKSVHVNGMAYLDKVKSKK